MSQILKTLKIEKFRQLKEFRIDRLGDVNLIVGGNNAGKSTLLDAIRFFASKGAPSLIEEILNEHGELGFPVGDSPNEQIMDKSICNLFHGRMFPSIDGSVVYVGEYDHSQFVQLEHVLLREEYEERDVDGEITAVRRLKRISKNNQHSVDDELIEAIEFSSSGEEDLTGDSIRSTAIALTDLFSARRLASRSRYEDSLIPMPVSYVSAKLGSHTDLAEAWDAVVLTEGEGYALDALRLIEPETTGIAFVQQARVRSTRSSAIGPRYRDERSAVLKMSSASWPVPLQSMGDGMTRVLQLVLSVFRAKNGFLLIDEFENGLHYSVQTQVWELLFELAKRHSIQIFATTHSQDAVNAFAEVANQHELVGELIRMERNDGVTVASNVSESSLLRLNESKIEVR